MSRVARVILGLAGVAVLASPTSAKGPAMTWEVEPETPVAGQPAAVVLRTWEWTPDGEADTSRPSVFFALMDQPLTMYVRATHDARGSAPVVASLRPIGPLYPQGAVGRSARRMGRAAFRADVVFPRPGRWSLFWTTDAGWGGQRVLGVYVRPRAASTTGEQGGLPLSVIIGVPAALAGAALMLSIGRRRS